MHRRRFLKSLLTLPVIGASMTLRHPFDLTWNTAHAASGRRPVLVVIFQRGGNDGLNTIVPYGDPHYAALRPSIAIAEPGAPGGCLDLNGFFGLHPALAPLQPFYQSGELAILPAVHYPNATRSHFESQRLLEGGAASLQPDGWLNRYLAASPGDGTLRGAAIGNRLPFALQGAVVTPVVSPDSSGSWWDRNYGETVSSTLRQAYSQPSESRLRQRLAAITLRGLDLLDLLEGLDIQHYAPPLGIVYPDSPFGRQLRRLAQILKADLDLEVATIDLGGWDTHAGQGAAEGAHADRLQDYAQGIRAFYQDMVDAQQEVLILTMTDFGRTPRENGSQGTDHGHAATWMVLGPNVSGGIHGHWPGLAEDQLYLGRYLAHSLDFRDVMGEILSRHLQAPNPATLLAGHTPVPIGFL